MKIKILLLNINLAVSFFLSDVDFLRIKQDSLLRFPGIYCVYYTNGLMSLESSAICPTIKNMKYYEFTGLSSYYPLGSFTVFRFPMRVTQGTIIASPLWFLFIFVNIAVSLLSLLYLKIVGARKKE